MSDLDDDFIRQAIEAEAAEKERQANRGNTPQFEPVKYAGLEKRVKLIRFVGKAWDFNLGGLVRKVGPTDGRVVRIAAVVDDRGKTMRLILPLQGRDDQHPLVRLILKVTEGKWIEDPAGTIDKKTGKVKNIKVYEHEKLHPEIFEMIQRSNLDPTSDKAKYGLEGKGWSGKEFFVANVKDYELLDWHRANKKFAVLSKSVNLGKTKKADGTYPEYAEPGVPAFGFTMMLNSTIIKFFGNPQGYDVGIERTGMTQPAYNMYGPDHPAVKNHAKVGPEGPRTPLTAEELAWEMYDLDKIFGITSYTKIWNRLQKSLQKVDAMMGTGYAAEIKALADEEARVRKANAEVEKTMAEADARDSYYEDAAADLPFDPEEGGKFNVPAGFDASPAPSPVAQAPAPAARTVVADEGIDPGDREKLPGWSALRAEDRDKILSAVREGDKWNITFSVKSRGVCQKCGGRSPETFEACPHCGASFVGF